MTDIGVIETLREATTSIVAGINAIVNHRFVPYNGKIADITESDTNKHTLDLATALSETREIVAIYLNWSRMSGSGNLLCYPNEGSRVGGAATSFYGIFCVVIAEGTNRLQYSLEVANDDFDVYCMGYVVEV